MPVPAKLVGYCEAKNRAKDSLGPMTNPSSFFQPFHRTGLTSTEIQRWIKTAPIFSTASLNLSARNEEASRSCRLSLFRTASFSNTRPLSDVYANHFNPKAFQTSFSTARNNFVKLDLTQQKYQLFNIVRITSNNEPPNYRIPTCQK